MTVPGEFYWPSLGNSRGLLWGISHGHCQMTKGEASDIISARMAAKSLARLEPEKATSKQLWLLRHEHISVPDGITKEEASKIIASLMAKRRSLSG